MLNLLCPRGGAAETDDTHLKQSPAEECRNDGGDEIDDRCPNLICRPRLKVIRDEVDIRAGTLWARYDRVIVYLKLPGRPDLESRARQGNHVQSEGCANVRYRLCHKRCDRHQEKPALKAYGNHVLPPYQQ
jgi:hypothetical protein